MHKRTTPKDAGLDDAASDLDSMVTDKRAAWRANGAKARRRQRRYKNLLTQHLVKLGGTQVPDLGEEDE
jgi:hypothetical protein